MRNRAATVFKGVFLLGWALLFLSCSNPNTVAGTATQSGNGAIAGRIVTASGPAAGANARIRPESYLAALGEQAGTMADVVTDQQGYFVAESLDMGSYRIEATSAGEMVSVLCTLTIDKPRVEVDTLHLQTPGVIVGTFVNVRLGVFPWYVQIYGLERVVTAGSDRQNNQFIMDNIPHGVYRIIVAPSESAYAPLERNGVVVMAGDTIRITFTQ